MKASDNHLTQGGLGVAEKDRGSFFLETARGGGLSKYVIRGTTIFGNRTTMYGLGILHNETAPRHNVLRHNQSVCETTNDDNKHANCILAKVTHKYLWISQI